MGTWDWAAETSKWVPGIGQPGQVSGYLGVGSGDNKVGTWDWAAGTGLGIRDKKVGTWEWAAGTRNRVPGSGQQGQESGYLGVGSRDNKVGAWAWAAGKIKWLPGSGQQGQVSGYLGVGSGVNKVSSQDNKVVLYFPSSKPLSKKARLSYIFLYASCQHIKSTLFSNFKVFS